MSDAYTDHGRRRRLARNMAVSDKAAREWYCRKCGGRGNPQQHKCPIVGKCPDCKSPWTLGREADVRVHAPGGLDCLSRQNAALRDAILEADYFIRQLIDREDDGQDINDVAERWALARNRAMRPYEDSEVGDDEQAV